MRVFMLLLLLCLEAIRAEASGCVEVSKPAQAVDLVAQAAGKALCLELASSEIGGWSFQGYHLESPAHSNVSIDCRGARISGLYHNPIVIGDNSIFQLRHCDVYTYEHTVGAGTKLQAFIQARTPHQASFEFLSSFRFWPCNEVKRVYERAFEQHEELPSDPFEIGPVITNNGSSAFTFIDADGYRVTRTMGLRFTNVTYYCGQQNSRWKNAVLASRIAAVQGHTPEHIEPGDFPSEESGGNDASKGRTIAIIVATVVTAIALLMAVVLAALFVRRRRRLRHKRDHDVPSDSIELRAPQTLLGADASKHALRDGAALEYRVSAGADDTSVPRIVSASIPIESSLSDGGAGPQVFRTFEESDADLNLASSATFGRFGGDEANPLTGGPSSGDATSHKFVRSQSQSQESAVPSSSSKSTALLHHLANAVTGLQHNIGDGALTKHCLIGTGAFSLVYRGTWRQLDVAVKAVVFEGSADNKDMQRIVSEVAIAMSIEHENIVDTYTHDIAPLDEGNGTRNFYKLRLVQEFCNGGTLYALMNNQWLRQQLQAQQKPLRVELQVLRAIASAGILLHSKRIAHADFKPQNVMLKYDASAYASPEEALLAGAGTIKVMDFGLAQRLQSEKDPHLSRFNAGTRWYAAPEVLHTSHLFLASDVYSFGVIAWELVTHSNIVERTEADRKDATDASTDEAASLMERRGWAINSSFPHVPDTVPGALRNLISRCLRTEHTERPHFTDVVAELDHLLTQC